MINKIFLNYNWFFKENYEENDLKIDNFDGFISINLPHTNKETPLNNFDETISHITSIYKRIIKIDDLSKTYNIVFEGIGHYSKLFVNGKYVCDHNCGYTRFKTNISNFIQLGNNEIAIIVDSHEIYQPPFGFVIDYLCFGGIYRESYLEILNNNYIQDYYFHNDENNFYIDYKVINKNANIRVLIKDKDTILYNTIFKATDKIFGPIYGYSLWSIDNPKLYTLELQLIENSNIVDIVTDRIGIRTIKFTETGFYLNNQKLKIRGANRHQSYPYVGYAMPKRAQYEDALKIKQLGFNAVRCSHYPQSINFLNACDELGLLVFEELPGWQYVGNDEWQNISITNVIDMVNRDKNHPSIIIWGVRVNESGDYHDFYTKTNEMAHKLDPYRPTGGVRCFAHSELLEDIYTYNDFVNSGKDIHLREKEEITSSTKPYLVSEYGGHMFPTKAFDNEIRRTEHAMIHANVLKKAYNDDKIIATFAWCFADYNTHRDFGSGDLICYHGVCDIFRNIKYAAYPYMTYQKEPFLEVTSNCNIGEHNGGYIRGFAIMTNCDLVKMYHNNILVNSFEINDFKNDGAFLVDVNNLIGDLLIKCEGLTKTESDKMKMIINEVLSYDGIIRKETTDKYGIELTKKAWNYYGKHISNWGSRAIPYVFEGYKNNKLVCKLQKGPQSLDHIAITISTNILCTKESYDVCKVTLEAIGSLGNRVDYSFDSFKIEVNNSLEIIGDSIISLIAGVRSFYVKSKIKNGIGEIKILSDKFTFEPIKLEIKEIQIEEESYEKYY
ncbi:MAG: glycoside hydrolase family 2 protein [Anaeroplasma sp.]